MDVDSSFWERLSSVFHEIVYYLHTLVTRLGNFMASYVLETTNNLFIIMNNIMKWNYLHKYALCLKKTTLMLHTIDSTHINRFR